MNYPRIGIGVLIFNGTHLLLKESRVWRKLVGSNLLEGFPAADWRRINRSKEDDKLEESSESKSFSLLG